MFVSKYKTIYKFLDVLSLPTELNS